MSLALGSAQKLTEISQASNPKDALKSAVGDLSGIELYFNHILVAIYIRNEKTTGGIIRPTSNVQEDIYQGKVGLVLKKGPMAFRDDQDISFIGQNVNIDDWVVYRSSDGWQCQINGVNCRVVMDRNIRMRVKKPEELF